MDLCPELYAAQKLLELLEDLLTKHSFLSDYFQMIYQMLRE